MSWLTLKILSNQHEADALSDTLESLGACAISLEDAADEPLYEPPIGNTPLWQQTWVVGLFMANANLDDILLTLVRDYGSAITTRLRVEQLQDREWQLAWRDHFKPLCFGHHLWVASSEDTISDPDAITLILAPGLAFGTGMHPTTALCLEWLAAHPPVGLDVLDYGCGSGILAIAALKLGARCVVAVDHDPQALAATRQNALQNQLNQEQILTCFPQELPTKSYHLLLANILAQPLIDLAPTLLATLAADAQLVLSGVLSTEQIAVQKAYLPSIEWQPTASRNEWVRLNGKKR